ncbi:MAG: PilZ domain-containing protein [Planctomycetaceae bacterium]|nr:PilZ domain-containing protein [Planctomycetaceae bacterium]
MSQDPWTRPSVEDLRKVLESIGKVDTDNLRANERLELSVPAEIRTQRGNTISAMTREISRTGIGLFHRGAVSPGQVEIRMASDSREFRYDVRIEWCAPCDNGMYMSGGTFLATGN